MIGEHIELRGGTGLHCGLSAHTPPKYREYLEWKTLSTPRAIYVTTGNYQRVSDRRHKSQEQKAHQSTKQLEYLPDSVPIQEATLTAQQQSLCKAVLYLCLMHLLNKSAY